MSAPKISAIVAVLNGQETIEECLGSVLGQSVPNLEVVIADDASTDRTVQVVRRAAQRDSRVVLVESPFKVPTGPGAARNRAVEAARGEWIQVVDADDAVDVGRATAMLTAATRLGGDVVFDNLHLGEMGPYVPAGQLGERVTLLDYARSLSAPRGTVNLGYLKPMIKRSLFNSVGGYSELFHCEDSELALRLLALGDGVYVPTARYRYRRRAGALTDRPPAWHMEAAARAYRALALEPDAAVLVARAASRLDRLALRARVRRSFTEGSPAQVFLRNMRRPTRPLLLTGRLVVSEIESVITTQSKRTSEDCPT